MKGPSGRITYQAKRMWHCPKCQRKVLTGGHITNQACTCQPGQTVWMHVASDHSSPRDLSPPPSHAS
ncbi:MAG: hypothetical protein K2X38_15155 [Gemmataceae bacterium]|nr:hypothetical protein [Gemmataceae bacterium]